MDGAIAAAQETTTILQRILKYIQAPVENTIATIPVGLVTGTLLLTFLTFNLSIITLIVFYSELFLIKGLVAPSFQTLFPTLVSDSTFLYLPLYLVTATLSYLNASLVSFSDVLNRIGGEYGSKMVSSLVLSVLVITALFSYYVLKDAMTVPSALFTIFASAIIGSVLLIVNQTIFGKNAVNYLGLPLLSSTTGSERPIYACGITA
jgi:hypothetical protein